MYAKLAGFVGGRGNDSAVVTLASNDHCLAFERGVEQLFDRHEEGIHVDVKDSFDLIRQGSGNAGAIVRQSRGERQKRVKRGGFAEIARKPRTWSLNRGYRRSVVCGAQLPYPFVNAAVLFG
jgi:hypothetical protein